MNAHASLHPAANIAAIRPISEAERVRLAGLSRIERALEDLSAYRERVANPLTCPQDLYEPGMGGRVANELRRVDQDLAKLKRTGVAEALERAADALRFAAMACEGMQGTSSAMTEAAGRAARWARIAYEVA